MATAAVQQNPQSMMEIKGDTANIHWHIGQWRAWNSQKRFILVLAGTQSGKTSFGPHWLYREIKTKGPGDYLAVTATYPLLENKMLPEMRRFLEVQLHAAIYQDARKVFLSTERIHGAEAWRIIVGSAANPESLESATALAAWLDEAGQSQFRREAWEAVRRRLSIYQGRCLITTTPYSMGGWLKSEFYDRGMAGDLDVEIIQFDSTTNPAFPKEEFDKRRAEMPAWKFNMFYRGKFDRPVGLIYDSFAEDTCKIKRFAVSENWPCYVGHDFGGTNAAAMFFRVDPVTGHIYAWAEYHPKQPRSTYEHVEEFKRICTGVNVLKRVGGSHQEEEIRQAYTANGWPISEPSVRDVEAGIDRVYALFKLNKIFVFSDLSEYLDELATYSRKLDDNYLPTDEIENKSSFHLLDCLVAGTQVATASGPKPIEDIAIGDNVLTRKGYRPVIDLFRQRTKTITAAFSNGATLQGTPSHNIFVEGKGYIPLRAMRYNDTIRTCNEKQLTTMAGITTDTPNPSVGQIAYTSNPPLGICTASCGRMHTAISRRTIPSIIRTMTRHITSCPIWSARTLGSICQTTWLGMCMTWNTLTGYVSWPHSGTVPLLADSGTVIMANYPGKIGLSSPRHANTAARPIGLSSRDTASSVPQPVKRLIGTTFIKTTNTAPAPFADNPLSSTDMPAHVPALADAVRCLGVTEGNIQTVYDLCVADVHEYYANGILVHNSTRYILSDFTPDRVTGNRVKIKRSNFRF